MSRKSHGIRGAAPQTSLEAVCMRCEKVAGVGARREMLQMLIGHFQHDHGDVPQVLIESPDGLAPGDFTSHPAPYRCDLCGVKTEPPWWTMVTPRTVDYKVEDPGWLVCDPCQVMVVANDLMGLVKRYMQQASHTYAVTRSEAREIALDLMPGFLRNVDLSLSERHSRYSS